MYIVRPSNKYLFLGQSLKLLLAISLFVYSSIIVAASPNEDTRSFSQIFHLLDISQPPREGDTCFEAFQYALSEHDESLMSPIPAGVLNLFQEMYELTKSRRADLLQNHILDFEDSRYYAQVSELASNGTPFFTNFTDQGGDNFLVFSVAFESYKYADTIRSRLSSYFPDLVIGIIQCEIYQPSNGNTPYIVGGYSYVIELDDSWKYILP